ncbi:MAG: FHA domain-containing protein, partial [Caldimonas sp.]
MISITVTSHNGTATPSITGHFDETGGNIGRAENNQLVLPDPERTISRVHAQIVYRNGKYAVIDRGSNAISVNGRPLGNGQEAMLQIGDEISIGGYSMRVQAGASPVGTVATDPFADFGGLAGVPSQGSAGRASAAEPSVVSDPLAAFGVSSHGAFAAAPMSASAAATGGIPLDWDPFAPDPQPVATGNDLARSLGQASSPSNFGLDVGGRAEALIPDFGGSGSAGGGSDSLDALFGLSAGGGRDPLAGSALNEAAAQPNMAAHADPLKSLNSMTRGNATAAADTSSELRAPFMLPPMMPTAATPEAATPRPTTAATLAATPSPSPPHAPVPAAPVVPQHASHVSGFSPLPVAALPASTSGQIREAVAPPGSVLSWTDASGETQT